MDFAFLQRKPQHVEWNRSLFVNNLAMLILCAILVQCQEMNFQLLSYVYRAVTEIWWKYPQRNNFLKRLRQTFFAKNISLQTKGKMHKALSRQCSFEDTRLCEGKLKHSFMKAERTVTSGSASWLLVSYLQRKKLKHYKLLFWNALTWASRLKSSVTCWTVLILVCWRNAFGSMCGGEKFCNCSVDRIN